MAVATILAGREPRSETGLSKASIFLHRKEDNALNFSLPKRCFAILGRISVCMH